MTRRSSSGAVSLLWAVILVLIVSARLSVATQKPGEPLGPQASRPSQEARTPVVAPVVPPADYVIGLDDILTVTFWHDKDLSADVVVRPDGKIGLPLVNEVEAAGLTTQQLKEKLTAAATRFLENPNVTVVVKEIKSRKVFITGRVERPGAYVLTAPTRVLQLIAMAGGLKEFADAKHIVITRMVSGTPVIYTFNYKDVTRGRGLRDNIELTPGDTVVVP